MLYLRYEVADNTLRFVTTLQLIDVQDTAGLGRGNDVAESTHQRRLAAFRRHITCVLERMQMKC